jgi:hypothetical protein
VVLGLGWAQLVAAALCVVSAVSFFRAWPGVPGLAAAAAILAAGVLGCRPAGGRLPGEWASLAGRFGLRRRRHPGSVPASLAVVADAGSGRRSVVLGPPRAAPPLAGIAGGLQVVELEAARGQGAMGAVLDKREGTLVAVLSATGPTFCLADRAEQERRLAAWAAVMESVGTHRNGLWRLQWCQRALAAARGPMVEALRAAAGAGAGDGGAGHGGAGAALEDYAGFVAEAESVSWEHETLVAVAVRCSDRRQETVVAAAARLKSVVSGLRSQLLGGGFACDGPLGAGPLARALFAPLAGGLQEAEVYAGGARRSSIREHWSAVEVDGWWHRTYWVAQWPLSQVAPDFLSPLLSGRGRRCFSVGFRPLPPERAVREAEASRTAQLADAQLRAQGGFIETARHRRRAQAVEGREERLADGRAGFEFAGYVTLSAASLPELDDAGTDLEHSAGCARLRLQVLYGQQLEALSWSSPLARGI